MNDLHVIPNKQANKTNCHSKGGKFSVCLRERETNKKTLILTSLNWFTEPPAVRLAASDHVPTQTQKQHVLSVTMAARRPKRDRSYRPQTQREKMYLQVFHLSAGDGDRRYRKN